MPHSRPQVDEATVQIIGDCVREALSVLGRDDLAREPSKVTKRYVDQLFLAVTSPDRLRGHAVIEQMLADGIQVSQIADQYIPRAAELLGEAWCNDNIDFAATTIGSARLQGLLRSLGPEWCAADTYRTENTSRYCVVVPDQNQHTLGAMLIAGQLRRQGISVDLEVGRRIEHLESCLKLNRYDAVLVSAYTTESLANVHKIVRMTHATTIGTPVVVGGGVLAQNLNVERLTGCDLATNALDSAVAFCEASKKCLQLVDDA